MDARTPPRQRTPDGDLVARTRERFLTADSFEPHRVRDTILASWRRSRRWNVAPDRVELPYQRVPDLDTPLARSALPVLRALLDHLDGQPISLVLTDASGLVLVRLTADRDLERHLDRVHLAPGFSYAEEFVGTNGIGTALEGGRPMQVFGHEHYAEHLEDLACAGVPVQHPVTGKTVGAVDLTCWRRDADPLLIALARTAADQIRQALLTDSSTREVALLQEYLRTCRRTAGIVLALDDDVVMSNEHAREVLDPGDQAVLISHATQALATRRSSTLLVDLPTGLRARLSCRPVHVPGATRGDPAHRAADATDRAASATDLAAGGVVQVKILEPGRRRTPGPVPAVTTALPGLAGSGALWLRACREVDSVHAAGEWLALAGEPGVGKLAVLRAVQQRRDPAARFRVLDAEDCRDGTWVGEVRRELTDGEGTLVLRHVDRLDARRLHALAAALETARAINRHDAVWVAATLGPVRETDGVASAGPMRELLASLPSTVELPPLRHHAEDLHDLVPLFLGRLHSESGLTCSPEAMKLLLRSPWPGNTEQLWQVLRRVAQHRRSGLVRAEDLPPECWTVSRRMLSPLESMERDAIVASLRDAGGSKAVAAGSLGMSRATIYRKIHEYGIVLISP